MALNPDLLAAVGEFVPALGPYAAALGDRLITAADPVALGPVLAHASRETRWWCSRHPAGWRSSVYFPR